MKLPEYPLKRPRCFLQLAYWSALLRFLIYYRPRRQGDTWRIAFAIADAFAMGGPQLTNDVFTELEAQHDVGLIPPAD